MTDEHLQLLVDLHKRSYRQGPGSSSATHLALNLAKLPSDKPLKIADIGSGTGASSLFLAEKLNAKVIAVDFLQEFLDELIIKAKKENLVDKISTLMSTMEDLPFSEKEFDVIWSEGAIYNMGFSEGISYWKRFLKPGGKLVVSEITWITNDRPEELTKYWENEYPQVDTASSKMKLLEQNGYTPEAYFYLPTDCWIENYYGPLSKNFDDFLEGSNNKELAKQIIERERTEITFYEKYKDYYSYGVYIAKKL
ncbi:MAG: class I SAM-dependent methyltransferase [Bdellovibrionales bacterium]|nr:class I SAM-dependent methyltransferase [Bdellovibrionales bacterium]